MGLCSPISIGLFRLFSDPLGARTQDPNIKSVVLYQLSERIFAFPLFLESECKGRTFFLFCQIILHFFENKTCEGGIVAAICLLL